MSDFIVMDAETKLLADQVEGGWNNVYGMGMSSAVTYCSATDMYKFWPDISRDHLCRYLHGKVVVTFNGIQFDSKLLLGDNRIIEPNGVTRNDKYKWANADIYVEIWRHIFNMDKSDYPAIIKKIHGQKFPKGTFNLDSVATNTLKISKSGDGAHAPALYQQGRIVELFEYNLQDVRVEKELYLFIKKMRYIVTGGFDVVSFD